MKSQDFVDLIYFPYIRCFVNHQTPYDEFLYVKERYSHIIVNQGI